jgi:tetratricopeptide (TPR) repeat protein/predicted Ser/Thr protein kinase
VEATLKQKIGKYEITGILGRGGMGVVYRAEDKRIGRKVAIKTLTEGFSGQPEMLERFYREAQAGILQHPNIVIVYDLGDEDGTPFIVMEFVEGEPLDKLINSGRQISLIDKLSIIEQVCGGLGYAHRRGVVHRDIKPANVIVQPDGHAKIVDFGIARVQGSGVDGSLTRTGNVIGTIHYIAPERLKGQPFDGRSDIFATGVMLYYLIAGQLPFSGEDMTVLQKLVNEQHPPLSTWVANYPPELDAIIDRSLAKDPDQRYATAEEFAADLHGLGEELKKGQIVELFADAERLAGEQQFGRAREVLLQLVRIDPQHTGARQLLGVVQQSLARLQRAEQVRQLIAEAEEAILATRFPEAVNSLDNALRLDPDSAELKAKLADAKEKKQRYDEISTLMTQADSLGQRGDWTGAAKVVEKAMHLDQQDSKIRTLYGEYSRQAKIAAQQGQIRELLGKAKQELSSRRFTQAIEILREVGKIDPSQAEMESLLQTAVSAQEQERRRKLLEQIHAEIENSLAAEDFDRATDLVERAVQQLPTESSLIQLKSRVALQTRSFRARQFIATTVAKAQELFLQSPEEALAVVQNALKELPGEERLLALEDSLLQRLKAAAKEETRSRFLRRAQEAMDKGQFEQAIEILESYQLEFLDSEGVGELLDLARNDLAQQKRRERIAAVISQARALMNEQRFGEAVRLLEPAGTETGDPALARLLAEARTQQEEAERKMGAQMVRILRLRERGQLEEAIELLQAVPAVSVAGSQPNTLLNEIRAELQRKQATSKALTAATEAIEQGKFQAAIDSLESVQRAYGESAELKRGIAEIEARRKQLANEAVTKALETARSSLAANDAPAALQVLKGVAQHIEFADPQVQADWKRLGGEAAKPVVKKAGTAAQIEFEAGTAEEPAKKKMLVPLIAGGALVVVLGVGGVWWFTSQSAKPVPQQTAALPVSPAPAAPIAPAAPSGTLLVQGSTDGISVFVDGPIKGFTQNDGSLKLPLDPGTHNIRFTKAGFSDCPPATVTIKLNAQATVHCQMKQLSTAVVAPPTDAYLTIHSTPNASLSIDGAPQGKADARGDLIVQVKPGSHALSLGLEGFLPSNLNISIKAGERKDIVATLNPVPVVAKPAPAPAQPVTALFSASTSNIEQGQSTTLNWQTAGASEVSIDNGVGQVGASGQKEVTPGGNTTYVLTAKGEGGTQQRTINIVVQPKSEKPAPPAPVAPVVDDSALIRAVVNSFNSALSAHNVSGMQAAWPGMKSQDAKKWLNLFKNTPGIKVSDNCSASALSVSGDTATWGCSVNLTIPGSSPLPPQGIRFTLAKKNNAWLIEDWR